MEKVVCNSSPIIALSSINSVDLLVNLYDEIVIPASVYHEVTEKASCGKKELIKLVDQKAIYVHEITDVSYCKKIIWKTPSWGNRGYGSRH